MKKQLARHRDRCAMMEQCGQGRKGGSATLQSKVVQVGPMQWTERRTCGFTGFTSATPPWEAQHAARVRQHQSCESPDYLIVTKPRHALRT